MERSVIVEPSLLEGVTLQRVSRCFDLGMDDYTESSDFLEEKEEAVVVQKKPRLSLSLKKKVPAVCTSEGVAASTPTKRHRPVLKPVNSSVCKDRYELTKSEFDYEKMCVPFVPQNTKKNNDWAYKNFVSWRNARNLLNKENPCPEDLLEQPWDVVELSYWLPRYACETRTQDGKKYPAATVYSLLGGLLRRMRSVSLDCPNFLDTKDARFRDMHAIIDTYFRELRMTGVGADVKHASLVTKEEENALWEKGVMGLDTPERLFYAVFYYNGKNLCLRGGKEHRSLKISQFVRYEDPDRYIYTENGSKNRSGGLNQMDVENKSIPVLACDKLKDRCHFQIIRKYLSKLPNKAFEMDCFYMKPLGNQVANDPDKAWFANQACGENKLANVVKTMFSKIGVTGKTNHS